MQEKNHFFSKKWKKKSRHRCIKHPPTNSKAKINVNVKVNVNVNVNVKVKVKVKVNVKVKVIVKVKAIKTNYQKKEVRV